MTNASAVRVVAVADWARGQIAGAMSFSSGEAGELIYAGSQGWLCVRVAERTGWVPADYWRIVTDVRHVLRYSAYWVCKPN